MNDAFKDRLEELIDTLECTDYPRKRNEENLMAPPPQINMIPVVIRAGQSISDPIDCTASNVLNVAINDWEPISQLTFQISADNNTYYDLCWENGHEVKMTVWPNTAYVLTGEWRDSIRWMKIRSGTSAGPVPQKADRTIRLGTVA